MIRVAITPDSRREWRSRGATRYWIVAPRWIDVEIKQSPAIIIIIIIFIFFLFFFIFF